MRGMLKKSKTFTLLEVMISLAVISISLTAILKSHALNIDRVTRARDSFIFTLLARGKMAEAEILGFSNVNDASGSFFNYPDFYWERRVSSTRFEDVKKIVLNVSRGEKKEEKSLELVLFLTKRI